MQRNQNGQNNFEKEGDGVGGLLFVDFKTYCVVTINPTRSYFHNDSHVCHGTESTVQNVLFPYNQWILGQKSPESFKGERTVFSKDSAAKKRIRSYE